MIEGESFWAIIFLNSIIILMQLVYICIVMNWISGEIISRPIEISAL
jgi:hypothetical protein